MTFQDLLEYFSYLCPELNICQCYHFQGISPDKRIINIIGMQSDHITWTHLHFVKKYTEISI